MDTMPVNMIGRYEKHPCAIEFPFTGPRGSSCSDIDAQMNLVDSQGNTHWLWIEAKRRGEAMARGQVYTLRDLTKLPRSTVVYAEVRPHGPYTCDEAKQHLEPLTECLRFTGVDVKGELKGWVNGSLLEDFFDEWQSTIP